MNEQTSLAEITAPPLVDWKNAPTLLQLKEDLSEAKPFHDAQGGRITNWLDNLNVTGKAAIKSANGGSSVVPKLIRRQAEWRYAALSEPFLSTENVFNVKPKTWEDREAARQNGLVLNHQFNHAIDKVKFIDEYVRTAVDEGTVIVRTGWVFEEEPTQVEEPIVEFRVNHDMAQLHEQLAALKAESPSQYATDVPPELQQAHDLTAQYGRPIEPVVTGTKMVEKMKVTKNRPSVEIVNFKNVVFDPTCEGDMERCGFAVETFETSLAALKKNKRYKNLDYINFAGASVLSQPDHAAAGGATNFNHADNLRKKLVAYRYWGVWDIHGKDRLVPVVITWVGDTIIQMEESPFPDKQVPFVVVQYLPVRKATYGEPDGHLLEDNQKVIGAVTRGVIDIMGKSANGQTGMRKDMLDTTNRRRFEKGLDYEFNPNVDPRVGVHMHTYPEVPQSASFMLQLQNFEAESLTGVKSWSQGVSGAALGDVAAGVRGALDAASKRELGILRRLKNGIVQIGRKLMSMNAEFLSDEEIVRITNEEFVTVRRDDLAGTFDLELSISTAEEDNNKAEQLAFLFQTIGPNGDPGLTKMILGDIARLRKMPDMAKKIESYEPQPDPLAQRRAELELELLAAQVEAERAKAQHFASGAGLQMAKANTEGEKASNLRSDTDKKNLDFIEQESGVTQERAKELHSQQAVSQTNLALVKHDLDSVENQRNREHDLIKEYVKSRATKNS